MIIKSLLDNDLYKILMGQVVWYFFSMTQVKYKFIDREDTVFPEGFAEKLQKEVNDLCLVKLQDTEYKYLSTFRNIYPKYLEWFKTYQFDTSEVQIKQKKGKLDITIEGLWYRTIYWEVPLMAIISELYFKETGQHIDSTKVQYKIKEKIEHLKLPYIDFGTRRRYSFEAQDKVVWMHKHNKPWFLGTSNMYLAMINNVMPIGTYAHETIMAMSALFDAEKANNHWITYWRMMYGNAYSVALTDTFTTKYFMKTIDETILKLQDGFRLDSGNPFEVADWLLNELKVRGIDAKTKKLIFSDNLNPKLANELYNKYKDITNCLFGIGTNLTNDFGFKPLNMVIKLDEVNGKKVAKLSDSEGKNTGDNKAILKLKKEVDNDNI